MSANNEANERTGAASSPPLAYQLDAPVLDEYLHSLLLTQFLSSLDPLHNNNSHETKRRLRTLLSALLPVATLWMTQAQTPATKAVGLKTILTSPQSSVRATLWKYTALTAILPLLYDALQRFVLKIQEERRLEEEDGDGDLEAEQHRIARERQYTLSTAIVKAIEFSSDP